MRQLVQQGQVLKAPDAIHVASAKRHGAAELHTYDERLRNKGSLLGIKIMKPHTREPRIPGL
jgi:predicted nucleic acid-binding protein